METIKTSINKIRKSKLNNTSISTVQKKSIVPKNNLNQDSNWYFKFIAVCCDLS